MKKIIAALVLLVGLTIPQIALAGEHLFESEVIVTSCQPDPITGKMIAMADEGCGNIWIFEGEDWKVGQPIILWYDEDYELKAYMKSSIFRGWFRKIY